MMAPTSDLIIIQRVIPHYRVELFRRLYKLHGIRVVTSERHLDNSFLNLADPRELPFAVAAPFRFPDPSNQFRTDVPTQWIMEHVRPRAVIAEFGLRMSSTYELAFLRRTGRLERLAFWTHGWQMERGFETLADQAVQYSRLPMYAAADAIATYTDEGATWVRQMLPHLPVIGLGNALDTHTIARVAAKCHPVRHGQPQLLAIGRLTADKGFDELLKVFHRILLRFPEAGLTIIGDGPWRARLEALAGGLLGGAVRMVGGLYDEGELAPHFLGADFLVLPGAAGLSVNHALAYALPVVAYARQPGGPNHHPEIEYVINGVTGILVSPPTVEAMADAITSGLEGGTERRLRNNLVNGAGEHSLDSMVLRFGDLVTTLNEPRRYRRRIPRAISPTKIAFVWDQFGDYHVDRCEAVAEALPLAQVLGIEFAPSSKSYAWAPTGAGEKYTKITLFPRGPFEATNWIARLIRLLDVAGGCDAVFLTGYERPDIFWAAVVLRILGRRVLVMNDSKFNDKPRWAWREWFKGLALAPYSGALLAAAPQVAYFRFLGFRGPIATGYDTVSHKRLKGYVENLAPPMPLERRPFVFIGRFVAKKNILTLVRAYGVYVRQAGELARDLKVIGDGPLLNEVQAEIAAQKLTDRVHLPGFLDGREIALALREAYALIVPSIEDQWALVVNEALAFNLPIIASTAVGATSTLVRVGVNGLLVEPNNEAGLAFSMKLLDDDAGLWLQLSSGSRALAPTADVGSFVAGVLDLSKPEQKAY